jgi:hypothetical protein|tara:strand:- start:835 stop:1128 length:294 start_codon:yes stop_codon:yes gene_type:complete
MATLRVSNLRGRSNGESPSLPDGAVVTGVTTSTTFSGNVTGTAVTATTFTGALTGNATGLSGSPDVTVNNVTAGIITASNFVGVPPGFSELDAALFN